MARLDTATRCHCGAGYEGSDHCPTCGCEQYESGDCGHTALIVSGGRFCGTTVYTKRVFSHPFGGFEIVLAVTHWGDALT